MTGWRPTRTRLRRLGIGLVGHLTAWVLRALGTTWRITREGLDPLLPNHPPVVAAFWHRNVLIAAHTYRDRSFSVAVSRSRDGDLITALLVSLGYRQPPRGSSTRGGAAALHELVRLVEAGATVSIQTDGPQGPPRVSKVGVVTLARLTERPIQPIAFSSQWGIRFRSWDGTLLPPPFAKVVFRYGEPIPVPPEADEQEEEQIRAELDEVLNHMTDDLDARLGFADGARIVTRKAR